MGDGWLGADVWLWMLGGDGNMMMDEWVMMMMYHGEGMGDG